MARAIEYHADDYGMFPAQSRRILDCVAGGACNGVSVMPNSPYLDACMEELSRVEKKVRVALHLNLVQGRALSDFKDVSLLTGANGVFCVSYARLLLASFLPVIRDRYRKQLTKELRAQMRRTRPYIKSKARLDSHVHYHMIPVVFDAMMDAAAAENLDVGYIRFPAEPLPVYFKLLGKLTGVRPVNLVKTALLNALAAYNRRRYRGNAWVDNNTVFAGVLLSGHMFPENMERLLPELKRYAAKRDKGLEILFHPGAALEDGDIRQLNNEGDRAFLTSENRKKEADALRALKTRG